MQAKHERQDIFIGDFNPWIASVRLRQCSWILTIAREKPEPEEQHGKGGACGVDDRVVGRGVAAGDEGLMYLVESGVGGGQEERSKSPSPAPASAGSAKAAIQEQTKHEVFAEMCGLANEVVNDLELRRAHGRIDPQLDTLEDGTGVRRREGIGG